MNTYRRPESPFECLIPSPFELATHGVTYYGYCMSAIDVRSGNDAEILVLYSPTHEEAVDPYVESYLSALSCGDGPPENSPFRSLSSHSTVVFAFEQPVILNGVVECFHVAGEICARAGGKVHTFYGRAFVGAGRLDFKFSASTSVDAMKEVWRSVIESVRVK